MGQGTDIGWIKMIAEELDLPTDRVSMVQGHTDVTINMGGASGSTGIWKGGHTMRLVAAEARRILVEMAAERLGVPAERLTVNDGVVSDKNDASKKVSYGELIGGRHFDRPSSTGTRISATISPSRPRPSRNRRANTRPSARPGTRRRDVAPKVLGTLEYMVDVKVPGMLHGRMIRPPVAGAVPTAIDESSVKDIPGVKVVWQKGFIGVVAPKEWDAIRASEKLKVTWSNAKPPFPEQCRSLRPHPQGPGRQTTRRKRSATSTPPSRAPPGWSRRRTNGRSSRMPAWRRPAAWPTCATAKRRCGPARRRRTTAARASPRC